MIRQQEKNIRQSVWKASHFRWTTRVDCDGTTPIFCTNSYYTFFFCVVKICFKYKSVSSYSTCTSVSNSYCTRPTLDYTLCDGIHKKLGAWTLMYTGVSVGKGSFLYHGCVNVQANNVLKNLKSENSRHKLYQTAF